ncbi:restriction endonuclease subunit S (plasmid) [Lactococcus cremoris]|uniref:restriction endonuclease subunit S n=2 Tax=Streptococcaceae TaxID=1300 RepID=UPI00248E678D|nr:restriction endonuclease subunit S [Lactococcus cremoris]WGU43751.1 restriction endonuclease subunit S [Lactococcus cremoris]
MAKIDDSVKKKVPELRFPGFTDDWEERKLKDVTERVRSNDGRMDLPTLTMSASSGWLDQKDRFSGDISGKEKKNYTLLKKGELSYNHGNSKLAKYGVVFSLTNYEEALVPRVYHSFKALENTSADFIEYMFSTKLPDRELGKLISSGARMDGLLNINYDDFMNIHISIPNYEEQILMSAFFRKLDENIALHQRKLDLLKEQKKGYLQKMFPKNGEKVPELRFAGFADDWEERKLGDLLKEFSIKSKIEDEHKVLSSTNSGMEFREGRVSGTSNLGYKIIKNGDLVLSPQNLWLGNININNIGKGLVSPSYKTFEFINIDSSFINPQLRTQKMLEEYKNSSTQGASVVRRNLEIDSFYQIKIFVPTISEQEKIGSFFKQLDDTIALHQRKLDLLKEQKKGFLQKMFV